MSGSSKQAAHGSKYAPTPTNNNSWAVSFKFYPHCKHPSLQASTAERRASTPPIKSDTSACSLPLSLTHTHTYTQTCTCAHTLNSGIIPLLTSSQAFVGLFYDKNHLRKQKTGWMDRYISYFKGKAHIQDYGGNSYEKWNFTSVFIRAF